MKAIRLLNLQGRMKKRIVLMIIVTVFHAFAGISAFADASLIEEGNALLQKTPPEYEKAAQYYRRAGIQGNGEGYYLLGKMYEAGLLVVGNPCTDDISALGKQKAEEYYELAAKNGYEVPSAPGWKSITQEEAREMMEKEDGHVIVDVRRQDEYDAGHIPDAILIPVEWIGPEKPEALPDPDQVILIYCRSGNRSKQAAQKLFDMGYTKIYEFGGIIDWTGEIVTEEGINTVPE